VSTRDILASLAGTQQRARLGDLPLRALQRVEASAPLSDVLLLFQQVGWVGWWVGAVVAGWRS
jgi:hypothetical protein